MLKINLLISKMFDFIFVNLDSVKVIIIITIFTFFVVDWMTKKNFRSVIVSLGIFGTFLGILSGLDGFSKGDILKDINNLLGSLRLAFETSVIGIFLSVVLSIKGMFTKSDNSAKPINKQIVDSLNKISSQSSEFIESLNLIRQTISSGQGSVDEKLSSIISSLDVTMKKTSDQSSEFIESLNLIRQTISDGQGSVDEKLSSISSSLDVTMKKISEGATKNIIEALNTVISDFNNNLTEQFGSNFKQLNEAVFKLVEWQENYKTHLEDTEKRLDTLNQNIEQNINHSNSLTQNFEKISVISHDLASIIKINENQINNLETHMKSLGEVGEKAGLVVSSIDDFSKVIKTSLETQSAGLNRLQEDLNKLTRESLPSSLEQLNESLTTLTNKFRKDYADGLSKLEEIFNQAKKAS